MHKVPNREAKIRNTSKILEQTEAGNVLAFYAAVVHNYGIVKGIIAIKPLSQLDERRRTFLEAKPIYGVHSGVVDR